MKNKFFITAVLACAFMFVNCSDNSNKETTEKRSDDDGRVETVLSTTEHVVTERGIVKRVATEPKKISPPINAKFTKDIEKVMKMVSGISTTGKTVLGEKRAKAVSKPSASYAMAEGSSGISGSMAGLLSGSTSKISSRKSSIKAKSAPRASPRTTTSDEVYLVSDVEEHSWDDGDYANNQKAGLLTAGEWNDLDNWGFWTDLLNYNDYNKKMEYWSFFPQKLVAVKVVDDNDVGIANLSVILLNGKKAEFVTKTDNAGYAYCWINLFNNETQNFRVKDLMLIVDGVVINGQLKITTKADQKLKMNIVVNKEAKHAKAKADVAFIVDATGSMSDEINFLKSDLSYIIEQASTLSNVNLRTAALFYRDIGDVYLTRHDDFTNNVAKTQDYVSQQKAQGGGDYPEAVHSALEASLQDLSWDESARSRIAFLILDAPAHYESGIIKSLQKSINLFAKNGIKLIPVAASGVDKDTEFMLRFFDLATGGTYIFLTDDSGIGNSHIKASVGNYNVESLADLMIKLIKKYVE